MGIQISSSSMFGIGLQSSGPDGAIPADNHFHWYQFTGMPYGLSQPVQGLPIEAGSSILPRGNYKSGIWGGGQVNMLPRLSKNLGYLLVAAMGLDTPATGKKVSIAAPLTIASYAQTSLGTTIDVTTSAVHGLVTGDTCIIKGATGTNASRLNGYWTVTTVDTDTLTLVGSTYAAAGIVVTNAKLTPDIVACVGSNVHVFTYNTSESNIPYFVVRRLLEGTAALGEQVKDNRISSLDFNIPNVGPLTASLSAMGRVPDGVDMFIDTTTGWVADYDSEAAFGLSTDPNSLISFEGVELQCTGLSFSINNNLLNPDAGRIIGSQTPLDFPVLSRSISVQATILVTDYEMYRKLYTGAIDGTQWSTAIVNGDLNVKTLAPTTFAATSESPQYLLQMITKGGNVQFSLPQPLPMNPNQPIVMTLNGSLVKPASGTYAELRMHNAQAGAYTHSM